MADIAALGFSVDSSPLSRATSDLDRLSAAAGRTEQAAMGVGRGYEAVSAPMQRAAQAAGQLSASLGRATQAANENARQIGLARHEYINLSYQLSDIVSQASAGASAFTIFVQQGGQIAPVLAQAGGRLGEVFGQVTSGVASAAARLGVFGGVVTTTAAAAIAGGYAWRQYAASQDEAQRALLGIGAASGATVASINRIAGALADAQTLSTGAARSITATLASTGKIDVSALGDIGSLTKGTAALFGESNSDAATRLGELFSNPTRGAEIFNQKLGILTATQKEYIENLDKSGQRTEAQEALVRALQPALQRYTDQTWSVSRAWQAVTAAIGSATDAVGHFVDRQVTGGTLQERLATATQRYFTAQRNGQPAGSGDAEYEAYLRSQGLSEGQIQSLVRPSAPGAPPRANLATATANLEDLNEQARRRSQLEYTSAQTARMVQASGEVDPLVKSLNPGAEKLKEIQRQTESIRKNLSFLPVDEQGDARRTMDGLISQAKQLRSDMAAGGAAYADALRAANFENKNVGTTGVALQRAQINQTQDNERLAAIRSTADVGQLLDKLRTIEEVRVTKLNTLVKETENQAANAGGALARATGALREQIIGAARGAVTPNLIAGIASKESNLNPNIGYTKVLNAAGQPSTTAYGLGQITKGTAEDAIRQGYLPQGFDRTNTETMAQGIAGVLQMKIDQAGGDVFKGLSNYYGSKDPAANRAYAADVMRRAGQFGDVSSQGLIRDQDALTRAQRDASDNLKNLTQNYGRSGEALELQAARQQKYNELLDRGVPASEAASIAFSGMTDQIVKLGRSAKEIQFSRDLQFERDQLGRSSADQSIFAQVRGRYGDTTSDEARSSIASLQDLNMMKEARSTFQDTTSSLITGLTRSGGALQAFTNVLTRLGDKAINIGVDGLGAALFGGQKGGGAGLGGLFSSIFGGASSAASAGPQLIDGTLWFANGGIMTSHGEIPLNRYANGGIANSPQMAIFGEGRGPEAYVPLPDGRSIPVSMKAPANQNAGGATAYTDSRSYQIDARGAQAGVADQIVSAIRAYDQEKTRNQAADREAYRRAAG